MTTQFDFHAPQYVDFNADLDDSDEADKFFDVEQNTPQKEDNKENKPQNSIKIDLKDRPVKIEQSYSPAQNLKDTVIKSASRSETKIESRKLLKAVRRRSEFNEMKIKKESEETSESEDLNSKDVVNEHLSKEISNISLKTKKRTHFEGIEIKVFEEKQHSMMTRNDEKIKTPKLELRSRSVIKDDESVRVPKRKSQYFTDYKAPEKYMALAEHVLNFQKATPPRFHTHKRRSSGIHGSMLKTRQSYKPRRTIALTPKLLTSLRSRPVEVPSQQEKETLELEEMKKHQIKAHPLNEKIFQPPKLPCKSEKPKTEPEPFNLTQVFKKPAPVEDEEPFKFSAKPAPKKIFEKPVGVAPKKQLPITVPESPAITKPSWAYKPIRVAAISNDNKESTEDLTSLGVPIPKFNLPKKTQIQPFSFELRDKEMMEKKEKKIKEILEAEKKAREFKANPIPAFIASKNGNKSYQTSHLDCSKTSVNSTMDETKTFKARSPKVLRAKKFEVVKPGIHSEPLDIQLWTERRAQERREFEMKQAEKEEQLVCLREQMEMEKKQKEMEELSKLRKETVHKAQPMPKFKHKEINKKISSQYPLTNPKSPRFTKRNRTTTFCSSLKQN